jgi:acetylornithine deacetylase/succinyl-diaminopimelate desuccinylase-like protein
VSAAGVDVVEMLERLVRIESVNPALDARGAGEAEVCRALVEELERLGVETSTHEVVDGRANVLGVLPGAAGAPTLLFESHMDTVPQPDASIPVRRAGGRLTGRGACDTKASGAAMVAALAELAASPEPHATVVFAGTVDEESGQRGAGALLEHLPRVDGAVIGEPTRLRPVRVHNGVLRLTLIACGRAAHTSHADRGVNAISAAARAVAALEAEIRPRSHELAGPALLTPAVIQGGTAVNVVPDRCEVLLDRRLGPDEAPAEAIAEIDAVIEACRRAGDDVRREEPFLALAGAETAAGHPLVRVAEKAASAAAEGAAYCTDAATLNGGGGLPFVVLGPGDIEQAHTEDEWVALDEVRRAVEVYAGIARAAVEAFRT